MAFINQFISNSKTGQSYLFLQTNASTAGRLLEMESTYEARSLEPPAHYHPKQAEDFTVLEGVLTVKIHGRMIRLEKGDTLHIPVNTAHAMWNDTDTRTVVNWKVQPALSTEQMLEIFAGLANDHKTNEKGMPAFLQSVLIAQKFSNEFRLAKPGYAIQKLVFALAAPIAKMVGYDSSFEKYTAKQTN